MRSARSVAQAAAVVLLMHALLLAVALRLGVWRDRGPAPVVQAPVLLWLVDGRAKPAAATPPAAATKPAAARTTAGLPPGTQSAVAPPVPTAAPAPVSPQAITLPAPPEPAASQPPPLNLALPRGALAPWRNPAAPAAQARSATPRPTIESRIAAATATTGERTIEEPLDDGRLRLRRGTACVIVHPSRAARIDPFNESFSPKMRGVEGC